MQIVKGMVQVMGTTYRIVRVMPRVYEAVRLVDDMRVGSFKCGVALELNPEGIDAAAMGEIARAAVQQAKTSWVGKLAI
jgi:hypothetical protein